MTFYIIGRQLNPGRAVVETFKSIEDAREWLEDNAHGSENYSNLQIVVDYESVSFYKEKFEELYEIMKREFIQSRVKGTSTQEMDEK